MAKYKSTAHHAVKVVHYDPRVALARRTLFLLLVLAAVIAAAGGGWYIAQDRQIEMLREREQMRRTIDEQGAELRDLRHRVAVLDRGNEVERKASEAVRREVRALNEKIYGLEKEITFYRNIMSPGGGADKLRIQRLEWSRRAAGMVHFKLVLTQVTEKRELIQGSVRLELKGAQDGEGRSLGLADLGQEEDIPFRFRYFQELEGEFALPQGFRPETVRVTARSKGRKPVEVEREFSWLLQEEAG